MPPHPLNHLPQSLQERSVTLKTLKQPRGRFWKQQMLLILQQFHHFLLLNWTMKFASVYSPIFCHIFFITLSNENVCLCVLEREMGFVGVEFRVGCSRSLTKRWCKKNSGLELGVRPRGVERGYSHYSFIFRLHNLDQILSL